MTQIRRSLPEKIVLPSTSWRVFGNVVSALQIYSLQLIRHPITSIHFWQKNNHSRLTWMPPLSMSHTLDLFSRWTVITYSGISTAASEKLNDVPKASAFAEWVRPSLGLPARSTAHHSPERESFTYPRCPPNQRKTTHNFILPQPDVLMANHTSFPSMILILVNGGTEF